MNRKQFIILLVLVAVVGGIGLSLYKKSTSTYQGGGERSGQKLLGEFNVNDVAQIVMKEQGPRDITLANDGKGWVVKERNNYPANFEQIAEFIRKAAELKVVQTQAIGPSQLSKVDLAEPGKEKSGTLVQFKDAKGQVIKSFQLGIKIMKEARESQFGGGSFPVGRYVLTDAKSGNVYVINDAMTQASAEAVSWLNKDFFKVEKPSTFTVDYPEKTNSWSLWRKTETDSWKLTNTQPGDNLDTNKVSNFASSLSYPSFNDLAIDKKPEDTGLDKPTVVKIETFDKFTYTLNVGKPTPDDTYPTTVSVTADIPKQREEVKDEKKEDKEKADKEFKEKSEKLEEKLAAEKKLEGWVYLIPKWTLESVLKKRSDLMVDKTEEKKEAAEIPVETEIQSEGLNGVTLP